MGKDQKTYYEIAMEKGYSRRDFMKLSAMMAAMLGLESSSIGQVAQALKTKFRPPVIWLHGQECTCCSESFIRASHPLVADILLDAVSLNYTETLMAPSGYQAELSLTETLEKYPGEYLLMVEGSVPTKESGVYCCIAGKTFEDVLHECAEGAKAVIAWGNCASAGCVQAANPNPTGATPIYKIIKNKPVINVQGCPPIADVMAGVIVYMLTFDAIPELDRLSRPKAFYSRRVHDTCYRRPNFDAGLFVQSFDDENAKKGYCLYKVGCKGPVTYNACGVTGWNEGVSFPIKSGHPCIGCSEAGFWDAGPFYKHLPDFPGFGIESNADKVGVGLAAAAGVGIAAHTISTNIRKRRLIQKGECKPEEKES